MATITAQLVKELRDRTGAGMMECKNALVESDGDIEKAIDILRTRGLAAAVKKEGRETNEGVVIAEVSADGKLAALAEVNCETDFVGTNEVFRAFAKQVVDAVAATDPADVEDLKQKEIDGQKIEDLLVEQIHKIGENMQISRFARFESDGSTHMDSYIHAGGKIGVIAEFAAADAETFSTDACKEMAHDVVMHIAATAPLEVSREDVAADVVEHELSIYKAQAAESGKPENIQEKMAEGRLEKFYKQSVLLEQEFVKDPSQAVKDIVSAASKAAGDEISVVRFERFVLGEEF